MFAAAGETTTRSGFMKINNPLFTGAELQAM